VRPDNEVDLLGLGLLDEVIFVVVGVLFVGAPFDAVKVLFELLLLGERVVQLITEHVLLLQLRVGHFGEVEPFGVNAVHQLVDGEKQVQGSDGYLYHGDDVPLVADQGVEYQLPSGFDHQHKLQHKQGLHAELPRNSLVDG
jgi:hypothetical protein